MTTSDIPLNHLLEEGLPERPPFMDDLSVENPPLASVSIPLPPVLQVEPSSKSNISNMNEVISPTGDGIGLPRSSGWGRHQELPTSSHLPPHSIEAEQAVLGALLIDPSAWDRVAGLVLAEEFYQDLHRRIFQCLEWLLKNNRPADVLTVAEGLEGHDFLPKDKWGKREQSDHNIKTAEILPYLGELASNTPSVAHVRYYAGIVRNRAILRQIIAKSNEFIESAYRVGSGDAKQLLDKVESEIFHIAESASEGQQDFRGMSSLMPEVSEHISKLYNRTDPHDITGLSTGFVDIDHMTSGFQKGDLIIVAGRPSMGKTSLAMNIAEHVALREGGPVAVFSMEMSASQIALRMLGSVARINQQKMRTGRLSDQDWDKFSEGVSRLNNAPIYVDDQPGINILELRARARRLYRRVGRLELIVIDYLQLMNGSSRNGDDNRAQEVGEISRALKGLARELDVPVIALSQLNRGVESRGDKRPMMSDLRESGAIEQDADLIFFIYRDEVYNKESPKKGTAEIIIAKQRNGPIGMCEVAFLGEFTRFENIARAGFSPSGSANVGSQSAPPPF